ncbi:uncharacterized protein LOC110183126 [Drosophila serrata]|uniref:uncharacterized protein LOC110183126 n=1 Tax=Drosophila serrata TaxID=7274 RepID=UPI000A1D2540|nr:uncharacterized protein LOC110183126 [Drosophila serrata]
MRGYLVLLFVALACSSMAEEDSKDLKAELDEINKEIENEKHQLLSKEQKIDDRIVEKAQLDSEIANMQNQLKIRELELAKINIRLERKMLELEHCINEKQYDEEVRRIVNERADEKVPELASEARKELQEKYLTLLQHSFIHPTYHKVFSKRDHPL